MNSPKFTLSSINFTPNSSGGGDDPDDPPLNPDDIVDGNFVYSPAQAGLHVGDDIDLSQTYYVQVDGQWKEVSISKDTYYVEKTGDTYNHYVQKTEKSDGFYGDADPITGWTPITGDGMYYMKDHNTFLQVQSVQGNLTHYAYSNKLIASKSGNQADGLVTGPEESIGGWDTGTTTAIVVERDGTQHQVKYANKGSTFHYNMFVYYVDSNGDVVYLTQGANESDGDSKYYNTYPTDRKSDTPAQGVGKYYYTYNNTLGSYGGKGYYTGTYYKPGNHDGKIALYFVDGGETKWLSTSGVQTQESARTTAIHDQQVVYTGPLYQLQTLQRATYFSYEGGTPVESRLAGDQLTNLTLYTRRMSGEAEITDTDPDNGTGANQMGTLVDTTNNFKGNLFIQKKLYRKDDGTYNIKLESWATGDMNKSAGGNPADIILLVDLSNSMHQSNTKDIMGPNGEMYRIDAVREAIRAFINKVSEADPTGENYRIAITSFSTDRFKAVNKYEAGCFVFNGTTVYDKTITADNYYSSLKYLTASGKSDLIKTIDESTPFAGENMPNYNSTLVKNGYAQTVDLIKARNKIETGNELTNPTGRDTVVVMFTDGAPGTGTGNGYINYASDAVVEAKNVKDLGAKIYTIGIFNIADSSKIWKQGNNTAYTDYTIGQYMERMSSYYPDATDIYDDDTNGHKIGDRNDDGVQYYSKIDTSQGSVDLSALTEAFSGIASTIATTDVPVTTSSILRDVINTNDFALPSYTTGTTVTAKTVDASAINSRKQITWDYSTEKTAEGVTITPYTEAGNMLNRVDVSGFDYQTNFSAPAGQGKPAKTGSKLVVRIFGLMPKHGGEVYSNSDAGILSEIKNEDGTGTGNFEMYLPVESPFDDIAARPYVVDFNASMKVAENAYLVSNADNSRKYVTNITDNKSALGQNNGSFAKDSSNTVTYQLKEKKLINGSESFHDYSYSGSDTALVFGAYYANDSRAESGKTTGEITTKQIVEGEKIDQTVAKAWQVVTMIPASSIYYDDDLNGTTAAIGDGSGYNIAVTASPAQDKTTSKMTFAFTGTGIDIYCTTHTQGGYAQAKLDGSETQTIKNYDKETTRYNVPSFSFRGLDYGKHLVEINILNSSNYYFDGVRVYGPEENQDVYEDTSEQFATYISMRDALVNDHGKDQAFQSNQDAVLGALFVDDSSKLVQLVTATDEQIADPNNADKLVYVDKDGNKVGKDTPGAITKINVYADDFAAYDANSPKQEIYLAAPEGDKAGQAIIFKLSEAAENAAKAGNLWIGLSAPNEVLDEQGEATPSAQNGVVTLNNVEQSVTSGVDMYYPITEAMIGANRTVTLTNTGSSMISVTNLKITGNEEIYNSGKYTDAMVEGFSEDATVLSAADVIDLVFEPVTMKTVMIAANNGVDPDAVAEEPGEPEAPGEPEDPQPTEQPADPTPEPTQQPTFRDLIHQIFSTFVSSLFGSIARLFGH